MDFCWNNWITTRKSTFQSLIQVDVHVPTWLPLVSQVHIGYTSWSESWQSIKPVNMGSNMCQQNMVHPSIRHGNGKDLKKSRCTISNDLTFQIWVEPLETTILQDEKLTNHRVLWLKAVDLISCFSCSSTYLLICPSFTIGSQTKILVDFLQASEIAGSFDFFTFHISPPPKQNSPHCDARGGNSWNWEIPRSSRDASC